MDVLHSAVPDNEPMTADVEAWLLKHRRRGSTLHVLECTWLNGKNATTDWNLYEKVSVSEVPGFEFGTCCDACRAARHTRRP